MCTRYCVQEPRGRLNYGANKRNEERKKTDTTKNIYTYILASFPAAVYAARLLRRTSDSDNNVIVIIILCITRAREEISSRLSLSFVDDTRNVCLSVALLSDVFTNIGLFYRLVFPPNALFSFTRANNC